MAFKTFNKPFRGLETIFQRPLKACVELVRGMRSCLRPQESQLMVPPALWALRIAALASAAKAYFLPNALQPCRAYVMLFQFRARGKGRRPS